MLSHGLVQLGDGPTHCVGEHDASQLDLMFVNDVSVVDTCSVLSPLADHCPTLLQLKFCHTLVMGQPLEFWDYNNADFLGLNNSLLQADWSTIFASASAEESLALWQNIVLSAVIQFVPRVSTLSRPNNKPWYTSHLCRLRRQRDRLFQRSKCLHHDHRLPVA